LQTGIKLSPAEKKIMEFGSLKLDFQLREAHITQRKVKLTKTEFEILFFLATHPHEVMSRDTLISQLWLPEDDVTDRIIDTHIRQIRQKLKQALPNAEKYIITVRGVGYYFNPQPCE
jgi:DNA-binding response OmpR family regulator